MFSFPTPSPQELFIPLFRCERYDQPQLGDRNYDEYNYERWTWQELGMRTCQRWCHNFRCISHLIGSLLLQVEDMSRKMARFKAHPHLIISNSRPVLQFES
jgi:hypothetical protein